MVYGRGVRRDPDPPWASFCLATYRRPDRLADTLRAIAAQTMPDFEVVVSDNDPAGSAGPVVAALGDPRFRYFCNGENLGAMKNFNAALSRAGGRFVSLMCDDDPPYPQMLATLRGLSEQHPGYGAYYGGAEVLVEREDLTAAWGVPTGTLDWLADRPRGAIRAFSPAEFPLALLSGSVFPVVVWSTAVVRRDVALAVGGIPDDEVDFWNDVLYLALTGAQAGCVTVNQPLGRYTYHRGGTSLERARQAWAAGRAGREFWREMRRGLDGFHGCLTAAWSDRPDWHLIRPMMERWLAVTFSGYLATAYSLKHGRAAPRTLEALRDGMTILRFVLAVPYLRDARSLGLAVHRWWVEPPVEAGRRLRLRACCAIGRLRSRARLRTRARRLAARAWKGRRSLSRPAAISSRSGSTTTSRSRYSTSSDP